jgi:single-strand DNA-binding protein
MINKVILVGNLGKDPEVRFTANGQAIAKFPVATAEKWKDQQGQMQERTEWHNVVVWGKQAEACGQYLSKGRQVFVEGRIQTRSYDDKDGNKRYITEIVAQVVRFLGSGGGGGGRSADMGQSLPPGEPLGPGPGDDDIPF